MGASPLVSARLSPTSLLVMLTLFLCNFLSVSGTEFGDLKTWIDIAWNYYDTDAPDNQYFADWYHSAETFVQHFTEKFAKVDVEKAKGESPPAKPAKRILVAGAGLSQIPLELMRQNCELLDGGTLVAADFNHFGLWVAANNFRGVDDMSGKSRKDIRTDNAPNNLKLTFQKIYYTDSKTRTREIFGTKKSAKEFDNFVAGFKDYYYDDVKKNPDAIDRLLQVRHDGDRQFHGFEAKVAGKCEGNDDVNFTLVYAYRDFLQGPPSGYADPKIPADRCDSAAASALQESPCAEPLQPLAEWSSPFDYILDKGLLDTIAAGQTKQAKTKGDAAKKNVLQVMRNLRDLLKTGGRLLWTSHSGNRMSCPTPVEGSNFTEEDCGDLYAQVMRVGLVGPGASGSGASTALEVQSCSVLAGHEIPKSYWDNIGEDEEKKADLEGLVKRVELGLAESGESDSSRLCNVYAYLDQSLPRWSKKREIEDFIKGKTVFKPPHYAYHLVRKEVQREEA